jgi:hypothetical protein
MEELPSVVEQAEGGHEELMMEVLPYFVEMVVEAPELAMEELPWVVEAEVQVHDAY